MSGAAVVGRRGCYIRVVVSIGGADVGVGMCFRGCRLAYGGYRGTDDKRIILTVVVNGEVFWPGNFRGLVCRGRRADPAAPAATGPS